MNLGNYTVRALEHVLATQQRFQLPPADAEAFKLYTSLLRRCQPFYLPEGGFLFERDAERYVPMLWKLPYPVTSLEYVVTADAEDGLASMPRRLVVCYELNELFSGQSPDPGVDALLGVVLFTNPLNDERWAPVVHVLACPQDSLSDANRAELLGRPKWEVSRRGFFIVPLDAVPAAAEIAIEQYGRDAYLRSIVSDIDYELEVLAQMLCWLELKNSTVRDLAPSASLNRKRASKGKPPLLTYKILDLAEALDSASRDAKARVDRHGPRLHMRRAHRRRHGNGYIGVRAHWVGSPQRGAVIKDYRIKGATA